MSEIKKLLKIKGMTQKDLAHLLNVNERTVWVWANKEKEPPWVVDYLLNMPDEWDKERDDFVEKRATELLDAIAHIADLAEQIAATAKAMNEKYRPWRK